MIWFVEFPTYKYIEDVKALAKKNKLQIIDASFQGGEKQCSNPPELTLKKEKVVPELTLKKEKAVKDK